MADPDERIRIINTIIVIVEGWTGRFVDHYYNYEYREPQWYIVNRATAMAEVKEMLHTILFRVLGDNCRNWKPARSHRSIRNDLEESPSLITPSIHDVLCGSRHGTPTTFLNHLGNEAFRALIRDRTEEYAAADGELKSRVIDEVIKTVEQSGGRFLIQDTLGRWCIIRPRDAHCKIIQDFRQAIAEEG